MTIMLDDIFIFAAVKLFEELGQAAAVSVILLRTYEQHEAQPRTLLDDLRWTLDLDVEESKAASRVYIRTLDLNRFLLNVTVLFIEGIPVDDPTIFGNFFKVVLIVQACSPRRRSEPLS
jgi:hypothetical protein